MALTSVETALATIRSVASLCRLPDETVALEAATARVLATPILSPMHLPPFDNSAMDGYVLPAAIGLLDPGSVLDVAGELAAGADPAALPADAALAVMTGAALPSGHGCVVPVEDVEIQARDPTGRVTRIRLLKPVRAGQHCRRAGEDIAQGQQVLPEGHRLRASDLPILRGIGVEQLAVRARPRVALLCTGGELVAPGGALGPGQIHDTNSLSLSLTLAAAGAEIVLIRRFGDDPDAFRMALQAAREVDADVVVSTGAVSMGRYDFIPEALRQLGAEQHFHKLAMRPGKPLLFATLRDGTLYFGLPGNPVSSLVGARFFVNAAIRTLLGLPIEMPRLLPLTAAVAQKPPLTMFQKARLAHQPGEPLRVERLAGQESFRIAPLLDADAWAVLPAEAEALSAGTLVPVYPLEPGGCGWP
jgi:molybdopterin molybdotransferase